MPLSFPPWFVHPTLELKISSQEALAILRHISAASGASRPATAEARAGGGVGQALGAANAALVRAGRAANVGM